MVYAEAQDAEWDHIHALLSDEPDWPAVCGELLYSSVLGVSSSSKHQCEANPHGLLYTLQQGDSVMTVPQQHVPAILVRKPPDGANEVSMGIGPAIGAIEAPPMRETRGGAGSDASKPSSVADEGGAPVQPMQADLAQPSDGPETSA